MPRFFIDTDDGDTIDIDESGLVAESEAVARDLALSALPDMAKEKMPDGDHRTFVVTVRDDERRPVYVATLSLTGLWVKRHQPAAQRRREPSP